MPIVLSNVAFEWPNGQSVFENLTLTFNKKVYGLVGANGAGKTTLARLIAGELEPTEGSIKTQEEVHYFKQSEEQSEGICLSGGEWMRKRLQAAFHSQASFLILDEPTNDLDRSGRELVHNFVRKRDRGMLLISHDRELLELADEIIELTSHGVSHYGGNYSAYEAMREKERKRLFKELQRAKKQRDLKLAERHKQLEAQAKRQRRGKQQASKGGMPKILIGARKRKAETTLASIDKATSVAFDEAVSNSWQAYLDLKVDPVMYSRLPEVNIPNGKLILEAQDFNFAYDGEPPLWKSNLNFSIKSPARIAITGDNGTGKSTLLKLLCGQRLPGKTTGTLKLANLPTAYLDQSYSLLNPNQTVFENVRATSSIEESELRNLLAMFLFKGSLANQSVSTLSGGEKLRASLAKVLLATPPAEILVLDEPTNNLDLGNIKFLEDLLREYRGALIVVSHDVRFLQNLERGAGIELQLLRSGFEQSTSTK